MRLAGSWAAVSFGAAVLACGGVACGGDPTGEGTTRRNHPNVPSSASPTDDGGGALPGADGSSPFGNVDSAVPTFGLIDGGGVVLDGSRPGAAPDDGLCGSETLEPMVNTEVETGTIIIVFDDSGSMSAPWGDVQRWLAAANAVRDAIITLSEFVTVGAVIFPSDNNCAVDPIGSQGQIRPLPGASFLAAWDRFIDTNTVRGGTPLGPALAQADAALQALPADSGTVSVLVLTDGEPNCDVSQLTTLPPAWLAQGIRTHVVGLPGSESAVTTLDALALAGGTLQHLTPDDPRALRRALASIVSETVVSALPSCTIPLDPPAPDPDDVHVIVTEAGMRTSAPRDLEEGGGWRITAAGDEIELFGNFCDRGLAGAYDRISIEFGCVDLPPLEPPPPVR